MGSKVPRFAGPLAAFLGQRTVLALVALWVGADPFNGQSWSHWDSLLYLDIAQRGYQPPMPCTVAGMVPPTWCGNTGWFPLYPMMVALLSKTGIPLPLAAVLLSASLQLAGLLVIDRLLEPSTSTSRRWVVLAAAAFFPGNVYFAAAFPVSLCLFCLSGAVAFGAGGRWARASVAAAGATAAYSTGILIAPAGALFALLTRRLRMAAALGLGSLAGYAVVMWLLHRATGRWDSFFLIQHGYGYHLQLPFNSFGAHLKPLVNRHYWEPKLVYGAIQTLLVTLFMIALSSRWRDLRSSPAKSCLLVLAWVFWLAPFMLGGRLSLYRAEGLLLPAVTLLPALGVRWAIGLTVGFALVSVPMAALFFENVLV